MTQHFRILCQLFVNPATDIATCVVLALVASRRDCQPRPNSQQHTPCFLSQQFFSQRVYSP